MVSNLRVHIGTEQLGTEVSKPLYLITVLIKTCKPVAIFNVGDLSATAFKFHDLNYSKESLQTQHITGKSKENHKVNAVFHKTVS